MIRSQKLILLFVLLLTSIVFFPSLQNGFTGWDDTAYLTDNVLVRHLTWKNIVTIFSQSIIGTYVPMMTLSHAIEYHLFGYNPFIYHLDNLFLHLANTTLVLLFVLDLGLPLRAAALAGLLFGIHPMHVESVAWVTERKDVLYVFFYLLSLRSYWNYLQSYRRQAYFLSFFWALLSILSKPMALSLPLILFVLDWVKGREWNKKLIFEKVPFLTVIVSITLITYLQHARIPGENIGNAVLIWIWTFSIHIIKFIWPTNLSPIYLLSHPVSLANCEYTKALIFFILFMIINYVGRRYRWIQFAFLYYFLSVFFLLRYDDHADINIVADRFMYLPSFGFCLLFGWAMDEGIKSFKRYRIVLFGVVGVLFLLLARATYLQCQIWKSNFTLWDYTISKTPNAFLAYLNRGEEYIKQDQLDLALKDTNKALELRPLYAKAYNNRGNIYQKTGQGELALEDYRKAIVINPEFALAYNNRGALYLEMNQVDLSLNDFTKAIELEPVDPVAYANRAKVYIKLGELEKAMADCNRSLNLDQDYANAFNSRGSLYLKMNNFELALQDFNKAIVLDPRSPQTFNNRCNLHYHLENYDSAIDDCNQAIKFNPRYAYPYLNRALIYKEQGRFQEALDDIVKAQSLERFELDQNLIKDLQKQINFNSRHGH